MTAPSACGCFPVAAGPPGRPDNLPGLDRLAVRVATHPESLARMLAALPKLGAGSDLERLTTRAPDDPAIALLDAAAMVADVLSFYSERIANEGYLRTGTERRSILELARAIGYELGPGVAASTFLSFTVEPRPLAPGASDEATVPAGTRVQSLPAGGGFPQSFETSETLVGHVAWNELRPQLTEEQELKDTSTTVYLAGTSTGVAAGEILLLAAPGPTGEVAGTPKARRVHRVVTEPEHDRTRVELAAAAAPPAVKPKLLLNPGIITFKRPALTTAQADLEIGTKVWSERSLRTALNVYSWTPMLVAAFFVPKAPPPPDLPAAAPGVYAFGARAAPFGHNALRWAQLPASLRRGSMVEKSDGGKEWEAGPYTKNWDSDTSVNVTTDSQGVTLKDDTNATLADTIRLDTTYRVAPDSWVLLARGDLATASPYRVASVAEASAADYAISAKVTQLGLKSPAGTSPAAGLSGFKPRGTTVLLQSERLELAAVPLPETVPAGATSLELDRLVLGLPDGHPVALTGERADLTGAVASEVVRLTDVTHAGGRTTLTFEPLAHAYLRRTIRINANVAAATHGETVLREALGSGNGRPHQGFKLRKPPLTYVSAATPSGAKSTLEVRVDGVRWHEGSSFVELGPRDERYVAHREDDGTTRVIFGDGVNGARPPTGVENVTADYRSGIGRPGLVDAGALTLLALRPPGIREVTNPLHAQGAEDPESRDGARRNAPLTVVTLDRVVSLTDYEDFARAFAGIGKARATELWHGERRIVHVTVAGPDGAELSSSSPALSNLVTAFAEVRDPGVEIEVENFRRIFFRLTADVLVDPRLETGPVLDAVRARLAAAFGFDRREFGQAMTAAEAITEIMAVPGVLDTRLLQLYPIAEGVGAPPDELQDPLLARLVRFDPATGATEPAELLLLNPAGAEMTERGA